MKIKKIALTAALALGLSATLGTGIVGAQHGADYSSDADIKFKFNTDKGPEIIDPEDKDKPLKPTDPEVNPGTNGPLSIDYISNFHFGEQIINGNGATYFAELSKMEKEDGTLKDYPNFIQITDDRANGKGWHLDVKQDGQFKTPSGQEIDGAELSFLNPKLESKIASNEPTAYEVVKLDPTGQSSAPVINAEYKEGMGTWINLFGKDAKEGLESIKLEVPGNIILSTTEEYKTTLSWELSDAPK